MTNTATSSNVSGKKAVSAKPGARATGFMKRNTKKPSPKPSARGLFSEMGPGGMWRFYTDDSPGIRIGPVPVLIMALLFIACVFMLHMWGKYARA